MQTTGSIPMGNFKAEVSLNGSSWVDISGVAVSVQVSGGEQQIGTQMTADGSVPVVTNSNKVDAVTIEVSQLYTETPGEGYLTVYNQYISTDKRIFFRYSPSGGAIGAKRYFSANNANTAIAVPIQSCLPPETDAGSSDPMLGGFTLIAPKLQPETIAS